MTPADEIRVKWEKFSEVWPAMWRAFMREVPGKVMKEDVWTQCQHVPVPCWDYILAQFRDMDSPPRNWAKKIKALHCQWNESRGNRESGPARQDKDCDGPICRELGALTRQGMPGRDAWRLAVENVRQRAGHGPRA